MKISKLLLIALIQLLIIQISYAENRYSYNAKIQCGNSSTTNNEYFSASNDLEAKNQVMYIMNNTGYRGHSCKLIELTSDKPKSQQLSKTYEVRIQCRNSNTIDTQYFSASNDMDAENEARRIINNNTGYRGRGCEIIEMLSR